MAAAEGGKKRSGVNWFLWWKTDPEELARQAAEYHSLTLFKTARGVALGCILFSMAVTGLLVFFGIVGWDALIDLVIWIVLALFIYLGHRWAMIAAMVFWTLEKILGIVDGPPASIVMQLIWWCVFMHAFYVAFRVEQERRKAPAAAAV
jgi:hypothetical protein